MTIDQLEDKLTKMELAGDHLGRAYDILFDLGYKDLANAVLESFDELGCEMASVEEAVMDLEDAE